MSDRGPDLLAYLLDQLPPDERAALESELAGSEALQAELDELRARPELWSPEAPLEAPAGGLARLLDAVRDEAAERRATHADSAPASVTGAERPFAAVPDDAFGADLVALALGQLEPERQDAVRSAVAADDRLQAELAAVEDLIEAGRAAAVDAPADGAHAVLTRIRREAIRQDAPDRFHDDAHKSRRRGTKRRGMRVLQLLVPAAIAATVLLAIGLDGHEARQADIHEGAAWVVGPRNGDAQGRWIGGDDAAFDFGVGSELEAGEETVRVEVECGVGENGDAPTSAARGKVEFELAPGARLRRDADSTFELVAGRVGVASGRLAEPLSIRHEDLFAQVLGTRFDVSVSDGRMVVVVDEGRVRIGRDGETSDALELGAGRQGLVDGERLLEAAFDGRHGGQAFLAPRLEVGLGTAALVAGDELPASVRLRASDAGPVTIAAFDDSRPLFLVRLKGPDGVARHVKVQRSMVDGFELAADRTTLRLTEDRPYELALRIPTDDLSPGTWTATVAYLSYRRRSEGDEWLGRIEASPVEFEVRDR